MKPASNCWIVAVTCLACCGAATQTILRSFPPQDPFDALVLLGDLDGDGVRDLAIAHRTPSTITGIGAIDVYSLRTGVAILQFPTPVSWPTFSIFRTGDYDGDGRDDLGGYEWNLVGGVVSTRLVVRSGLTGSYILQYSLNNGDMPVRSLHANGDGVPDFVIQLDSSPGGPPLSGRVDVLDGATLQIIRSHIGAVANQGLGVFSRDIGDVDGDGNEDYLMSDSGQLAPSPRYRIFSGSTGATISTFPRLSATYGEGICGMGDLNADGFDDLVLGDRGNPPIFGGNAIHVLGGPSLSQSPTLWSNIWFFQAPSPIRYVASSARIGDLDGDGHCDLALAGGLQGIAITILAGRDQSVLSEYPFPPSVYGIVDSIDGPGDVNGDGFPDVIVLRNLSLSATTIHVASVAPPGVAILGSACPDQTGRHPRIGVGVGARLGKTMTVNLSNANPALLAATLAIGFDTATWNGTPLPLDLTFVGMPGCNWYLAPSAVLTKPTIGVNGTRHHATHEVLVPQQSILLGLDLYSQWLVLEDGPNGLTGSTTQVAQTTVVQ
jgi:hypothetical protein